MGTDEKPPNPLDARVTTIVSDFTSLQITFLIRTVSGLMNLSKIAPLKNSVCQVKLNTQYRKGIHSPVAPEFLCESEQVTNVKQTLQEKKRILHMHLSFSTTPQPARIEVVDHLAFRDWEDELS